MAELSVRLKQFSPKTFGLILGIVLCIVVFVQRLTTNINLPVDESGLAAKQSADNN